MTQPSLFDAKEVTHEMVDREATRIYPQFARKPSGQQLKQRGMALSALKRAESLDAAQFYARELGAMRAVTIEDVRVAYENAHGVWDLGNAAGSVFKGPEWEAVGYREATRPEAHARIIRCWRLKR